MSFLEQKIGRVSMRDEAYTLIKNAIISGELAPETKVKDKELSEQLGISRTPVREAMLRLEDEELIVSKPNSYTMIAPINLTKVKEIYSIVIALEKLALQQASVQQDSELLEELIEINAQYTIAVENQDAAACLLYDSAFHRCLVQMANNKELEKAVQRLKDKILRVEAFYFHDGTPKRKSLEDHIAIITHLQRGDYEQAILCLEQNWLNSYQTILEQTAQ